MASGTFTVEFNGKGKVVAVMVKGRRVESSSIRKAPLNKVNSVTVPIHIIRTTSLCYVHTPDCRGYIVPC